MSVAAIQIVRSDESWRLPGCAERCAVIHVTFSGRRYAERVITHDPGHHEAYGSNALLQQGAILLGRVVATGCLEVDGTLGRVRVHGQDTYVTPFELRFLTYLAANIGRLCTAREVLRHVWGPEYAELRTYGSQDCGQFVGSKTIRAHLSRLRKRLGEAGSLIVTEPAIGYRLLDVPAADLGVQA